MLTDRLIGSAVAWTTRQLRKRAAYSAANPYLEGPYAPVTREVTETRLQVRGTVPRELNGIFARIGPNPMKVDNPAVYHWFVGDGMVHGLRLREGAALWYRNRWVGTDSVNRQLGRPPAAGQRHGAGGDTVNTNVIGHDGRLWALVEAGALPVELDHDLNTIRHGYFASSVAQAFTAHPHRDPATGELHAVCYDALSRTQVRYVVIGPHGAVTRDVAIPVRHGPMIHDCAITARYVLIFDLPITFSFGALLRGRFPYRWNPRHPARVGLLPRTAPASALRWFEIDPCYVFHAANAYDLDDGGVVVDVVTYPRLFDRSKQGLESSTTHFERWRLDPTSSAVARKTLSDDKQEFPRCDERRTGSPYRYAYTVGLDVEHAGTQPLYRHDLHTGVTVRHDFGAHHMPSEAVFVPRSAQAPEGDGWLLAYVLDLQESRSSMVILNAQDPGGAPQAIIELPVRVPLGFHGNWIADADTP